MDRLDLKYTWLFKKGLQALVGLALYFLLCELYRAVVVPDYSWGGFELTGEPRHGAVVPVLLLLLVTIPTHMRSMSDLFLMFSFYFLLLPASVLCALQGNDIVAFLSMCSAVVVVTIFARLLRRAPCPKETTATGESEAKVGFWLPFLIMALILAMLALHVDFAFRIPFSEIYDYRFAFNDNLGFPLNYLLPFAGGPLASFLAARSASRGEWTKVILVVFCGFLFYGFSTHKAFLFNPAFSVFVYFAIRGRVDAFFTLACAFGAASIAALIAASENQTWADLFGSAFANRIVFIPAQIHFVFFDEFSKIGHLYWSESKISLGLMTSPIQIPSVNYIAEIMVGDSKIGANVGWIANGFMNLGFMGVLIYAILLAILLTVIDIWAARFRTGALMAAFSVSILSIVTSNDLLVAMLTGGVLPMLLLFWILINQPRYSKS